MFKSGTKLHEMDFDNCEKWPTAMHTSLSPAQIFHLEKAVR
jgi:hypothetical protein